jgi:hypothetical protein
MHAEPAQADDAQGPSTDLDQGSLDPTARRLIPGVEVNAARQAQQEGKSVLGAVRRVDALGVGQDHVALDKRRVELALHARAGGLDPAQPGELWPQLLAQRAVQHLGIRTFGGQFLLGTNPDDRVLARCLANHVEQFCVDATAGLDRGGIDDDFHCTSLLCLSVRTIGYLTLGSHSSAASGTCSLGSMVIASMRLCFDRCSHRTTDLDEMQSGARECPGPLQDQVQRTCDEASPLRQSVVRASHLSQVAPHRPTRVVLFLAPC